MAAYMWDLGFNINAPVNANSNDGCPLLENGPVSLSGTAHECSPSFAVGDVLGFNLFNITTPPGSYQVTSGSIQFWTVPKSATTSTFPFSVTPPMTLGNGAQASIQQGTLQGTTTPCTTLEFGLYANPTGSGGSAVFGMNGNFPCWAIFAPVPLVNEGSFNFTVKVNVQLIGGGSTLTFRLDPEMIVGGTN